MRYQYSCCARWEKAILESCSALAALVFQAVETTDDRVIAVVVQAAYGLCFAAFGQPETQTATVATADGTDGKVGAVCGGGGAYGT